MTGDDARRQEIAARARVGLAVLQLAAEQVVTEANQAAGGPPVLVRAVPSVLDAQRRDLDRLSLQAAAWLEGMRLVDQWLLPVGDARTLGAIVKTMPPGQAAEVRRLLQLAGVLPADGGEW